MSIYTAPTGLTGYAYAVGINRIWWDNTTAEGVRCNLYLQRKVGGGAWETIVVFEQLGIPVYSSYDDIYMKKGVSCKYRAYTADFDGTGSDGYSNESSAIISLLPIPLNIGAVDSGLAITVSWSHEMCYPDITGFKVYRDGVLKGTVAASSYNFSYLDKVGKATVDVKYIYTVKAYTSVATSDPSSPAVVERSRYLSPAGPAPNAPTIGTPVVLSDTTIKIPWINNSPGGVVWFTVEYSLNNADWLEFSPDADRSDVSQNITGLDPHTLYYFRMAAYSGNGASPYSATVSATTWSYPVAPPTDPSSLTYEQVTDTTVLLRWVKGASVGDASYEIWADAGSGYALFDTIPGISIERYKAKRLTPDTLYKFKVRAYNYPPFPQYSNYTNEVTFTTLETLGGVTIEASAEKLSMGLLLWRPADVWNMEDEWDAVDGHSKCFSVDWTAIYPVVAVEINGVAAVEKFSVDDVQSTAMSYYYDSANALLYVHANEVVSATSYDPKYNCVVAYFEELFATHSPVVFNGREWLPFLSKDSVSSINLATDLYHTGGTQLSFGSIKINNARGYFNSRLHNFVYESKYLNFMGGEYTLGANGLIVPKAYSTFKTHWEGWSGNISWEDGVIEVETKDIREACVSIG